MILVAEIRPYKIFTDVTCDLPDDVIKELDISLLYLSYEVDGVEYLGDGLSPKEFYAKMRSGSSTKTAQVTPDAAEKVFEEAVSEGYDILHIAFSSGLSGSYNSARIAAQNVMEKHPDARVEVVDSLCASLGEGLLVYKAAMKKKEGFSLDELKKWVEGNRLHLVHMFTVGDLKYLYRGGRVTKTAAIAGTILGIKPVLHVDNDGRLIPLAKVKGRKTSLNALVDAMAEKNIQNYDNKTIAICHGDCIEDAEYVASLVKEKYGYENCIIGYTGMVIGSHSGPGTLALFFMGDKR